MSGNSSSGQEQQNLERWMTDLPAPLRDTPFIYLAIPGSHDSMTYGINRQSQLAPDAEPILHRLYPLFRGTILRWTITQAFDTNQQLLVGIRYFDLRLATKSNEENFYFTHGLYANEISEALEQVKAFVDTHAGEVVILDLQHFYGFQPQDHQRLMRFLLTIFGPQLVPRQLDLEHITLNSMARLRQQVIVIYRHEAVFATSEFWLPQMMPSPWPQKDRIDGLLNFFENIKRNPGTGFVHQAVLTPTSTFIVLRWTSNLKDKCAVPVVKELLPKLSDYSPGPPVSNVPNKRATLNVVIADFIELNNAAFPRAIIQLNWKLLRNRDLVYHNNG